MCSLFMFILFLFSSISRGAFPVRRLFFKVHLLVPNQYLHSTQKQPLVPPLLVHFLLANRPENCISHSLALNLGFCFYKVTTSKNYVISFYSRFFNAFFKSLNFVYRHEYVDLGHFTIIYVFYKKIILS